MKPIASLISAAIMAAAVLIPVQRSQAQAVGVSAGLLTCQVDGGWGLIFSSSRALTCNYSQGTYNEQYVGRVDKFGIDIGYLGGATIAWAVVAPTVGLTPGTLSGSYAGASGGASIGLGAAAHVLFGGSAQTLMLQPVSVQGDAGLNVAAGVESMTLQPIYRASSLVR